MIKVLNRLLLILLVLNAISISMAQSSFIHSYYHPNEVITSVRTVKAAGYYSPYILALEGQNMLTNSYFTRVQSVDREGNLTDDYADAFIGTPLHISSGLFEMDHGTPKILTPTMEYSEQHELYYLKMRIGYADHNDDSFFNGVYLPDSLQSVLEFPTVINNYYSAVFASENLFVAGRAVVNGLNKCIMIPFSHFGQEPYPGLIAFPNINFISGVAKIDEGYLGIGRSTGWNGKIVLVDSDSNLLWQQDFTDGADVSQVPLFTTPLLTTQRFRWDTPIIISYQNRDRMMHIARYQSQSLIDIFSLQLESYIGAIPVAIFDTLVAFAYVKNNKQYISQMDLQGNVNWTTELPGTSNFGKNSLAATFDESEMHYLIGGIMPQGSYYLAKIKASNGQIDNDTISRPVNFEVSYFPNPNSGEFQINLNLKKAGRVKLEIYNLKGQKVAVLQDGYYPAGKFRLYKEAKNQSGRKLPAGIYLIAGKLENERITRKITILPDR